MKHIVQIAGVRDETEARLLLSSGADYLGFPLRLAYHQPDLSEAAAAAIIQKLACGRQSVLITYLAESRQIHTLSQFLGVQSVQLHGSIQTKEVRQLRARDFSLKLIKSLIVQRDNFDQLRRLIDQFADLVDAFITDTFDPQTAACGATGKVHNWEISQRLVAYSPKPVILAGGLNPTNVREAILTVQPAGVDAHTGLEDASGRKDPLLVRQFIHTARQAFAELQMESALVVNLPIDGVLDLHTFAPREVKELIPEYLSACLAKGIYDVRIIHGKGTGALRETVQAILRKLPYVEAFSLADETGGGWGATLVTLRPAPPTRTQSQ